MDRAERRADLLIAARHVFATRGYHDAKVDDIVAAARVAKGTFYLYFPDKRSIFVELIDGLFSRIQTAILRVDVTADVPSQVKHNIRALLAVLLDDAETTKILMEHATGLDPEFAGKIRSFYQDVRGMLRESLLEGQRLGIVAPGDANVLATLTIGALKEVLSGVDDTDKAHVRETIVRNLFALLESGYLRAGQTGIPVDAAVRTTPAVASMPLVAAGAGKGAWRRRSKRS